MDTKQQHLKNLCDEYEETLETLAHFENKQEKALLSQLSYDDDYFNDYFKFITIKKLGWVALFLTPILTVLMMVFYDNVSEAFFLPSGSFGKRLLISLAVSLGVATLGRMALACTWGIVLSPIFCYLIYAPIAKSTQSIRNNAIWKKINSTKLNLLHKKDAFEQQIVNTLNSLTVTEFNSSLTEFSKFALPYLNQQISAISRDNTIRQLQTSVSYAFRTNCFIVKFTPRSWNSQKEEALLFNKLRLSDIPDFYTKCILTKQLTIHLIETYKTTHLEDSSGTPYNLMIDFELTCKKDLYWKNDEEYVYYPPYLEATITYSAPNGNYVKERSWT